MNFFLKQELLIVKNLLYKLKHQHKSTLIYKRLKHLYRMAKKTDRRALNCCENLYIACTSNLVLGHFVSLTVVIMGLCGRIWYLLSKNKEKKKIKK